MRGLHMGRLAGPGARLLAATVLALALGAVEARADHIFTLSNVTFDDGTLATGMFTTNDALNSLVNFDIKTSDGAITGFEYTPATAGSGSSSLPSIIVLEPASLDHIIQLTFDGGLTLAGAPILIGQFDSFEQDAAGTHRQVTGRPGRRPRRRPRTGLAADGRRRGASRAGDVGAETPGRMIP